MSNLINDITIIIVLYQEKLELIQSCLKNIKNFKIIIIDNDNNLNVKNKIIQVPGVFEIPVVISKNIKKYDAFIALGCVIKGETPHFNFISQAIINGVKDLNMRGNKKHRIPVVLSISTDLNQQQALDRAGGKFGNKGSDGALTALHLIEQGNKYNEDFTDSV